MNNPVDEPCESRAATPIPKRLAITTLGCRLNQFDSDALEAQARAAGWHIVDAADADVHIVNGCTITGEADADSRRAVRRAVKASPTAQVVVTGCFATGQPQQAARLPNVAAVVGNANKGRLFELLEMARNAAGDNVEESTIGSLTDEARGQGTPVPAAGVSAGRSGGACGASASGTQANSSPVPAAVASAPPRARAPEQAATPLVSLGDLRGKARAPLHPARPLRRARAYLKIQDGCDYRCSFCIVPAVRGPSRSLPLATLTEQLRQLIDAGAPEVVLTGVHLGTYGRDLAPRRSLAELVDALLPHLGPARLRLGSVDPHEVRNDLLDVLAAHPDQLCRHLHLPLQSGDPTILQRMRRAHTVTDLETVVEALVERIDGIGLGSDVIVGFPGESAAAFERTAALLDRLPLSYLHVFSYSRRQGTAAWALGDTVTKQEKRRRNRVLRQISSEHRRGFARRFVGCALPAVVLRGRDRDTGLLVGITDNYIRVLFDGPNDLRGGTAVLRLQSADDEGQTQGVLERADSA